MSKLQKIIFILGSITVAISLPTSRGFVTIGVITLIVGGILNLFNFRQMKVDIHWLNGAWKDKTAQAFLILGLPFLFLLVSGLYSEELGPWYDDLRVESIAIFLPLAALSARTIPTRYIYFLQTLFISSSVVACCYTVFLYFQRPEVILEGIGRGHHMPSFIDPIRFSLIVSFATLMSFVMFYKKKSILHAGERYFYLGISIFFFIFLHFFSVRTGIVTTYAGFLLLLIYTMVKDFKNFHLILILLIIALPIMAYTFFPSFKTKVNYMLWDWGKYDTEKAGNYSDSNRLISYELGLKIYEQAPFIGHGSGDFEILVDKYYHQYYPHIEKTLRPHNQFLSIAIETGVFSLIIFIYSLLFPIARGRWKSNILFPLLTAQVILSCLVENTLDNSVGLTFYLFWTCIYLLEWKTIRESHPRICA